VTKGKQQKKGQNRRAPTMDYCEWMRRRMTEQKMRTKGSSFHVISYGLSPNNYSG